MDAIRSSGRPVLPAHSISRRVKHAREGGGRPASPTRVPKCLACQELTWLPSGIAPTGPAAGIFLPRSGPLFVAVTGRSGTAGTRSGPRVVAWVTVAGESLQF